MNVTVFVTIIDNVRVKRSQTVNPFVVFNQKKTFSENQFSHCNYLFADWFSFPLFVEVSLLNDGSVRHLTIFIRVMLLSLIYIE